MNAFSQFDLTKPLYNAIEDLGFTQPTPMQEKAFSAVRSGRDIVGIAQTGTGKTLAYLLPILQDLKFAKLDAPRVLILVPTRELVIQVVEVVESLTKYMDVRVLGLYGGRNINVQKQQVAEGVDVLVATPQRLFDIAVTKVLVLKHVKKLVIDEVDVMLDTGFRPQVQSILEILPKQRQNTMFSATLTEEVDALIDDYFVNPMRISIALSGEPLKNIRQQCYAVPNFNTKVNLLKELIADPDVFTKVLVFISGKKLANRLFESLEETFVSGLGIIHGNKSQNFRENAIAQFEEGTTRVLIATDVMARGLDFSQISHVINFDVPKYPENYIHRIGRTGRAEEKGRSILFYTRKEREDKEGIEKLMDYKIPQLKIPEEVEITRELIPEERPRQIEISSKLKRSTGEKGDAFHEKSEKRQKQNSGGKRQKMLSKYKKPKTRGDKGANRRRKKR
jgi:ATP-dependent RNA helicase RhlE